MVLRIVDESEVTLVTAIGELTIHCKISDRLLENVVFVPYSYDGGVCALLARGGAPVAVTMKVAVRA